VRYRESAQLLLDQGSALRWLSAAESGALGESLATTGVACWASSTASYELAVCSTEACVEKLADYVRQARSLSQLMESRGSSAAALSESLAECDRLRGVVAAAAASSGPKAAEQKAAAEAEFAAAMSASTEARSYYDKVAAAFIVEAERYRAAMKADFQQLLTDFTSSQLRTELKLAAAWDSVAAKTRNLNGGRLAAPVAEAAAAAPVDV
jgi:hypothetical protein